MSNSIPSNQITERQLERLAAQRHIYASAKKILGLQMILAVPVALLWSVCVAIFPAIKPYSALWGIIVVLVDVFFLESLKYSWCQQAAKIQEMFDCDVLSLEWNNFLAGRRPDTESILEAAKKYKRTDQDFSKLKNWYPSVVGTLPIHLARIICQRANCWWDAKLRRRYAHRILLILCAVAVLILMIGLIGGMSVEKFILAVVVPLMPTFTIGIREYYKHRSSADLSDRLKELAEDVWERAKADGSSEKVLYDSRRLQDGIFNRRSNSALVFDWIYERLRNDQEEQMNKKAEDLVAEVLNP
jgi:hypothetical protein